MDFTELVARPKRFELLTPRFVVWCSIQLSYGRAPGIARGSGPQWQGLNNSAALSEGLRELLGLEADEELAVDIEHRPFDHGGLRRHQGDRLLLAQAVLILGWQAAERAA